MWVDSPVVVSVFDRNLKQDRVIWTGDGTDHMFGSWKLINVLRAPRALCPSQLVRQWVCVCLVHAPYWWPLITQGILIQSASFSHDCHTLAAAMATCRGRGESAREREARCLFFNRCDIYTHIIAPMDTHPWVSLPRFSLHTNLRW